MDYDPTQVAWDDEPVAPATAAYNGYEDQTVNTTSAEYAVAGSESMDDTTDHAHHEQHYYEHYEQTPVDG